MLSHDFTSPLAFANPIPGSNGKEERKSFSQDSNNSTDQQSQKKHRPGQDSTVTQSQQPVRFYPPQSSDGADEMELDLPEELEAETPTVSSSSSLHSSSSSLSSSAQESSSTSASTSSSATSIAFNKTFTLPLGLLFKVREYLTQNDLGRLKHAVVYQSSESLGLKSNGSFKVGYNVNNLNTLQKSYKVISLRNRKKSIRDLLFGLLPMNEEISTLGFYSSVHFAFSPEMFGTKQDRKLYLQRDSSLVYLDLTDSAVTFKDIQFIVNYFPKLEHLNLRNTGFAAYWIPLLSQLQNLKSLVLSHNHISGGIFKGFSSLPMLESLDLTNSVVTFTDIQSIVNYFPKLEHLNLTNTPVASYWIPLLSQLQNLKSLVLSHNHISDATISGLSSLSRLESLDLSGARIPAGTNEGTLAEASYGGSCLTSLNLSNIASFDGLAARAGRLSALLDALKVGTNLTSLDLSYNIIGRQGDDSRDLFQILKAFPNLTSLNLGHNSLGLSVSGDQPTHKIDDLVQLLQSFPNLTSLDLSSNCFKANIIYALLQAVKDLKFGSKLTSLNLSGNHIGPDGVLALVQVFVFFPELASLKLSSMDGINATSISALAQGLKDLKLTSKLKLTSLSLGGMGIGDRGIPALEQLLEFFPNLSSLDLHYSEFSQSGVSALKEITQRLLPDLRTFSITQSPFFRSGE